MGISLLTFPFVVFAVMVNTRNFWDLLHELICRMIDSPETTLYCSWDPFGIKGITFALLSFPVYALVHFLVLRRQTLRRHLVISLSLVLVAALFLTQLPKEVLAPGEWDAWLNSDQPLPPPPPGEVLKWLRNGAPGFD